jgi:hypothetical protein
MKSSGPVITHIGKALVQDLLLFGFTPVILPFAVPPHGFFRIVARRQLAVDIDQHEYNDRYQHD